MSITVQQAFEKASAERKEVDPQLHDLLAVDVGETATQAEERRKMDDLLNPELTKFREKCADAVNESPLARVITEAIEEVKSEFAKQARDFSKRANPRPFLPIAEMVKSMRAARVERDVENGLVYISEYGENNGLLIPTSIESA